VCNSIFCSSVLLFSHAATCASNSSAICGPSHTHTMCTIKVHGHFMGTVFKSFYNTTILISNCNEGIPMKSTNPLNSNLFFCPRYSIYSHTDANWSTITITITNNFIHHYNLPAYILYWTFCLTVSDVNKSTFKYLPHYITIFSSIQEQN